MNELKTSQEWYDEVPKKCGLCILDPDGWDRNNFDYSFDAEKITKEEFLKRISRSTIQCVVEDLDEWGKKILF